MQPNTSSHNTKSPDTFQDFIRSHKILFLIAVFLVFTLLIVLISFLLPKQTAEQQQTPEIAPIPVYDHRYLIDYSIGNNYSNDVFLDVSDVILSTDELASAPSSNSNSVDNIYTITLDEDSFAKLNNQPDYTYKVNLDISDGRTYTLYIRIDQNFGQDYMVAVLDRTDLPSASDHIFVYTNPDNNEDSNKSTKDTLTKWAKTFTLNNPIVTELDLNIPKK